MHYNAPHLAHQRAKEVQVLELINSGAATTRRALAMATGLRGATLNRIVASLVDRGVLTEVELIGSGRRGRPQARLALRGSNSAIIGLEFGRGRLVGVVLDAAGQIVRQEKSLPAPDFAGTNATMDALSKVVLELLSASGVERTRLAAVGIALHDVVTADGEWRIGGSSEGLRVQEALENRLGCLVVAEDVSRAFARAEHHHGAGQDEPDMIYLFLGSHGVGGGIFVNDHMLVSSSGICGELGHVMVDENGALCQCGSIGCFETVASHRAVEHRFQAVIDQGVASTLAAPASFTDICRAAGAGDKAAHLVLREVGDAMAIVLASAVNILGAPAIVLGGSLRHAGEQFLDHVVVQLRQRVISGLSAKVSVRFARLPSHAGAWGVAITAHAAALQSGALNADSPISSNVTDEGRPVTPAS